MALCRLAESSLMREPFPLYGTGSQERSFTFVDDVVAAIVAAGTAKVESPTVINVAGGEVTSMSSLIDLVGSLTGHAVLLDRHPEQVGDVKRTSGSIDRAIELLGWEPKTRIAEGVAEQVAWHRWFLERTGRL